MDLSDFKRISINKDYWFSIQPDKMIFGGSFLPDNIHCTFSYGLKSGFLDFHLRRNFPDNRKVYFPIIKIDAKDIYEILDPLKMRLLNAVFTELEEISEEEFIKTATWFIPLIGLNQSADDSFFNEVLSELLKPATKRKLKIDYKDKHFESKAHNLAEKFAEKWKDKLFKPEKINAMNFGTGILIQKESRQFFIKFQIGQEFRIYKFKSLDLDHLSVMRKFLGDDLNELITSRFKEGIESLKTLNEPKEFGELILSLKIDRKDD